jgi:hypothetical protein
MSRRLFHIVRTIILFLLILLIALWVCIQFSPVQTWLVKQASNRLSRQLQTEVSVRKVDFSIFKKIIMDGVLVRDLQKDTLFYSGRIAASFNNWFIFKDNIVIHEISLEKTQAYLHRKDSIWNYQFLIDAFSSPKKGQASKPVRLELKKISLSEFNFLKKDEWVGEDIQAGIGRLILKAKEIKTEKQILDLDNIIITKPDVNIYNYIGRRPPKKKLSETEFHQKADTSRLPFLKDWYIHANLIEIKEGRFIARFSQAPSTNDFDPSFIQFNEIQSTFKDLNVRQDSITADLSLATRERSGLSIKKLHSSIRWHARAMEFHRLEIETPHSILKNYFAMRYTHFNHDMNHFNDHVIMEGHFDSSYIDSKDIAFFAPALKDIREKVFLSGKANGTVENLRGKELTILYDQNNYYSGSFEIKGLPDYESSTYLVNVTNAQLQYNFLSRIIPRLKTINVPVLSSLEKIQTKGQIKGNGDSITLTLNSMTGLGQAETNVQLINKLGQPLLYKGIVKTSDFNLGKFLNIAFLGKISTQTDFSGKGTDLKTMYLKLNSNISSAQVNNYNYKNLLISGLLDKAIFSGHTKIDDLNADLEIDHRINLTNLGLINLKTDGIIRKLNLKPIGLIKNDISFSGRIQSDLNPQKLNFSNAYLNIRDCQLYNNNQRLPLDSLIITNTFFSDKQKKLVIHTNTLDAVLNGQFNLNQLGDIGQNILSVYFPSYFSKVNVQADPQVFDFEIITGKIEPFLAILNSSIKGGNDAVVKGSINTIQNQYLLNSDIPSIAYNNLRLDHILIDSDNNIDLMRVKGQIGSIHVGDSIQIPNTDFQISGAKDTGTIEIRTSITERFKNADLKSEFKLSEDGVTFNFLNSNFIINEKTWNIESNSDIFLGRTNIFSDGFRLTSGNEEIFLYTHPSETGNHNDLTIEIRKLELGELIPFFMTDPRIEGSSTGRIDVLDPFGRLFIEAKLTTERLFINNDSIGIVPVQADYDNQLGLIRYQLISDNANYIFKIKGKTDISKPDSIYTDNTIELNSQRLSIIEPYVEDIISNIKGSGTGMLRLYGYVNDPELIGSVRLNQASFLLDYTKCSYEVLPGASIDFTTSAIDFGNLLVKDKTGRSASFGGKINHSFFNKVSFDLQFETMNKNKGIQVLNTSKKDNTLFYGSIVAYANGSITGPANNISLKLRGQPTDSSKLYLATSDSRVTGTASFIVFRQYGKDIDPSSKLNNNSAINIDLDVIANPFAKVYLILDETTNDIIEGQGNGAINLKTGTHQQTSITGNYEITRGKYNFDWQSLFKRPFIINKGSIIWTGDPFDARINIDANYLVEQVKLPDELASGCNNERNNILVVANLSNTLKNPSIKFRFELPQGHPCRNNPLTNNGLTQLYNNPDELNRQVISLLLIGSFITGTPNQSTAGSSLSNTFFSSAAGTLTEFIAQQVTTGLGAVLSNVPGLKDLKLDPYITFTPGLITATQAQGMGFQGVGSFGFTRRLLNGRILLKAGGSMLLAAGQNTTVQNNRQLTPDVSVEWLVTPDGKLRLIGFYRTIFDIQRRNDRTGLSFSYVKEFDKIW